MSLNIDDNKVSPSEEQQQALTLIGIEQEDEEPKKELTVATGIEPQSRRRGERETLVVSKKDVAAETSKLKQMVLEYTDDPTDRSAGSTTTPTTDPSVPPPTTLSRDSHHRSIHHSSSLPGAFSVAGTGGGGGGESEAADDRSRASDDDVSAPSVGSVGQDASGSNNNDTTPCLDATLAPDSNEEQEENEDASSDLEVGVTTTATTSTSSNEVLDGKLVKSNPCKLPRKFLLVLILLMVFAIIVLLALGLSGFFGKNNNNSSSGVATEESEGELPSAPNSTSRPVPTDPSSPGNDVVLESNEANTVGVTSSSATPTSAPAPPFFTGSTMERIQKEGVIRCAYEMLIPGVVFPDPARNGTMTGIIAAFYNALAAALNVKAEYVSLPEQDMRAGIATGLVDVMIWGGIHTMEDDVFNQDEKLSFAFSMPTGYTSMRIGGIPWYVENCASTLRHLDECQDLRICIDGNSRFYYPLAKVLPSRNLLTVNRTRDCYQEMMDGNCNVVGGPNLALTEKAARLFGYTGEYMMSRSTQSYFEEPHGILLRSNDPVFEDFVSSVLLALFAAEKYNITQATYADFPQTDLFGPEYQDMFRNAIRAEGNNGEIDKRYNIDFLHLPRLTINGANNGSTGLLFSYPFFGGSTHTHASQMVVRDVEKYPLGDRLSGILQRGVLHCGIVPNRAGFATKNDNGAFIGMDADYCRAVAAGLFYGDASAVKFIEVADQSAGFRLLSLGDVDVLAGATKTLQNDVREATTGLGFAFSKPYYYYHDGYYSDEHDNFALATMQDDHDFSAFCFWVVMATIYAEENAINQMSSLDMPEVYCYGSDHRRMLRDVILVVGNYAQLYERNLQSLVPRGGRNMLNVYYSNPGPQFYLLPGIMSPNMIAGDKPYTTESP